MKKAPAMTDLMAQRAKLLETTAGKAVEAIVTPILEADGSPGELLATLEMVAAGMLLHIADNKRHIAAQLAEDVLLVNVLDLINFMADEKNGRP